MNKCHFFSYTVRSEQKVQYFQNAIYFASQTICNTHLIVVATSNNVIQTIDLAIRIFHDCKYGFLLFGEKCFGLKWSTKRGKKWYVNKLNTLFPSDGKIIRLCFFVCAPASQPPNSWIYCDLFVFMQIYFPIFQKKIINSINQSCTDTRTHTHNIQFKNCREIPYVQIGQREQQQRKQ